MRSLFFAMPLSLVSALVLASPPPPLTAYLNKDPRESVRGVSFLRHPTVLAGVKKTVPAGDVRTWVLATEDVAATPVTKASGWLIAHVCERHNCGDHQWSILIDPATGVATVCYHDAEAMGADKSRWYYASGQTDLRGADATTGGCP